MNRRSPRRAKRVESVTDVSYEIVRRLRYDDDDDGNDDDDDDDDDDDGNDDDDDENENDGNENENSLGYQILRSKGQAPCRFTSRATDRSIFLSGAMCAQLADINISASKQIQKRRIRRNWQNTRKCKS